MSNCPYCEKPVDRTDSFAKLPNGERYHFKCADLCALEWPELRTIARMLWYGDLTGAQRKVNEFYDRHVNEPKEEEL